MNRLRARVAMLCVLASLVPWRPLSAAPSSAGKVRNALQEDARAVFDQATTLFAKKRYAEARAAFQEAFTRSREPRVLFNIAVCEKELGHYAKAASKLRESLSLGGESLSPEYVGVVKRTLDLLAPFLGSLRLQASEDGASLYIDGSELGQAPLDGPVEVDVGGHDVAAHLAGFVDVEQHVDVPREGATIRLVLAPIPSPTQDPPPS